MFLAAFHCTVSVPDQFWEFAGPKVEIFLISRPPHLLKVLGAWGEFVIALKINMILILLYANLKNI